VDEKDLNENWKKYFHRIEIGEKKTVAPS